MRENGIHRRRTSTTCALNAPVESRLHGPRRGRSAVRRRDGARRAVQPPRRRRLYGGYRSRSRRSTAACRARPTRAARRLDRVRPASRLSRAGRARDAARRRARRGAARRLLEDYSPRGGLVPALVVSVDEKSARRVHARRRPDQSRRGTASAGRGAACRTAASGRSPTSPPMCSRPSDIVYVAQEASGNWRMAQMPDVQGALVAIDPQDGAIVALDRRLRLLREQVQPRDAGEASARLGVQAVPVLRGARAGLHAGDARQRCADRDRRSDARRAAGGRRTSTREFYGPTRLREALVRSRNLVSIRLHDALGPGYATQYIERFGFPSDSLPRNLSLALGTASGVAAGDGERVLRSSRTAASASSRTTSIASSARRQDDLRGAAALRLSGLRAAADRHGNARAAEPQDRRRRADPRAEQRRDALGRPHVSAGRALAPPVDLAAERLPDDRHDERRHPARHRPRARCS